MDKMQGGYQALQIRLLNAVSYTHLDVYKRQVPLPTTFPSTLTVSLMKLQPRPQMLKRLQLRKQF